MKLASLLLALAACGGAHASAPIHNAAPASAPVSVRDVDWANRTYDLGEYGTYTVKDGIFEFSDAESGEHGYLTADTPAFGDLTGDGAEEAAVVTRFNGGGTGRFSDVSVFAMRGGHEAIVGAIPGGDRGDGGIVAIAIADGAVRVDRYVSLHGGACCPEQVAHERWIWNGSAFTEDEAARTVSPHDGPY